jgi:hypothetical protein
MVEKWSEGDALGIARQGKGFFAMTKRSGTEIISKKGTESRDFTRFYACTYPE